MMRKLLEPFKNIPKKMILIYCVVYFAWGMFMNWFGTEVEIAKFTYWWQVVTCYILYMVPVSILLRPYNFFNQYAYGLVAMALLEFGGYALGTSYIYPDNIIIQWFGPHVFALGMALFFAFYFPIGNIVVNRLYLLLVGKNN